MEEKDIATLEEIMPDRRVRPSALTPIGGLFSVVTSATSLVLGKNYSNILLYSAEKGIMDEIDEQLRIMNERGI